MQVRTRRGSSRRYPQGDDPLRRRRLAGGEPVLETTRGTGGVIDMTVRVTSGAAHRFATHADDAPGTWAGVRGAGRGRGASTPRWTRVGDAALGALGDSCP